MTTNIMLDDSLVQEAFRYSGAKTKKEYAGLKKYLNESEKTASVHRNRQKS